VRKVQIKRKKLEGKASKAAEDSFCLFGELTKGQVREEKVNLINKILRCRHYFMSAG